MKIYGLIGKPLTHSFSKIYFDNKFEKELISDVEFKLFTLESIEDINKLLLSEPELMGFSVTIPYKEQIIKYLDEIDEEARIIGAVNSVKVIRNNNRIKLKGFNTDIIGFESSVEKLNIKEKNIKALVLGSGGASKAVCFVLQKLKIPFVIVSRNPDYNQFSYNDLTSDVIKNHLLIINTTPLGMFPNIDGYPQLPYQAVTSNHHFIDLTYNPPLTTFLKKALEGDAKIINGLHMLEKQAEASWVIWNL